MGTLRFCPPYALGWRGMGSNGLVSTACQPYRAMAIWRNIFRKIMAGGFFTELLAATHPPRKNLVLPQGKLLAFSLPHDW
jgi:hypothetical protein